MAHVFFLVEGREAHLANFLRDLNMRRYPYKCVDGQVRAVMPNMREIKLFNVSLPEQCISYLMSDLAPFAVNDPSSLHSDLKGFVGKLKNYIIKFAGLEPIKLEGYTSSGQVRHQWINTMPLGMKKDNKEPVTDMGYLPEGGELV